MSGPAYLAVGGGDGQSNVGGDHHSQSRGQLDAETTGGGGVKTLELVLLMSGEEVVSVEERERREEVVTLSGGHYLEGVMGVRSRPMVWMTLRPHTHSPAQMPTPPYSRSQMGVVMLEVTLFDE